MNLLPVYSLQIRFLRLIVEVNIIIVTTLLHSNATHSHVVRLLRGSGTRPTLVVSSVPQGMSMPSVGGRRASAVDTSQPSHSTDHGSMKKHSQEFREKMEQVLLDDERQEVIKKLTRFSQNR